MDQMDQINFELLLTNNDVYQLDVEDISNEIYNRYNTVFDIVMKTAIQDLFDVDSELLLTNYMKYNTLNLNDLISIRDLYLQLIDHSFDIELFKNKLKSLLLNRIKIRFSKFNLSYFDFVSNSYINKKYILSELQINQIIDIINQLF